MASLKQYLSELPDEEARAAFATRCGTSLGHMRNTFYTDKKKLSAEIAVAAEIESRGAVLANEVRSDLHWVRVADRAWRWHPKGRPVLDIATKAAA